MKSKRKKGTRGLLRLSQHGGYSVEFKRTFHKPIDEVWKTITDPSRLVDWYAEAKVDARKGGKIELRFANSGATAHGIVTNFDPPNVFEHMWVTGEQSRPSQPMPEALAAGGGTCGDLSLAASVIRFALSDEGDSTTLSVSHYVPLNPQLIPGPLAKTRASHVSEQPAPDMVLATWETLLELLDQAISSPGNRAMSLSADRKGGWPWDSFDARRQQYAEVVGSFA